ncbi:hypothetical protein ACVWXO_010095 [Bradyrhizobium sp. LM2.7]
MQAFDDRLANVRPAAAAIPKQEHRNVPEFGEVGAIDDGPALPLGSHEARARQDRQMRRKRIRRDLQLACKISGRDAVGLMSDQRPESLQPGRLRQGREGEDSFFGFHISRFMEIMGYVNRNFGVAKFALDLIRYSYANPLDYYVPGLSSRFGRNHAD